VSLPKGKRKDTKYSKEGITFFLWMMIEITFKNTQLHRKKVNGDSKTPVFLPVLTCFVLFCFSAFFIPPKSHS